MESLRNTIMRLNRTIPLSREATSYLRAGADLIHNAYDFTDMVAIWENVQRPGHNPTQFLAAVRQNGERMKALVNRIQGIRNQLNATREGGPRPAARCRQ